ncbi:hypothetical protein JNUCC1_00134 [Lentibacillus sp. JNUCC-1]|uniref:helical backbone metal receptor n=1 Tax=Lentibacillus sp. JNUCC-1 TaxID=2654513 RepID=UPI0012E820BE|nr:helical backbone metal receptor [Lentibacillus sp. JNUCC-1]MUV36332.1 hypothetical protein [Lentibacillus sp. JNUCC-1]
MAKINDHLGRTIEYDDPPQRIVSLVPAITETMYHLGLEKQIVGRTRFCKFPKDKVKHAVNVGGTKDMKLERIKDLNPDLIIAEKEENTKEMVEILEQYFPVFVFEIQKIHDVYQIVEDLGTVTDRKQKASELNAEIHTAFQSLPRMDGSRVAYVIWQNPYMVVGGNTYIQSTLDAMGLINPFINRDSRYPEVTIDELNDAELNYILLATEPFPFREKHLHEFKALVPKAIPVIIDGEMLWYGPKMLEAPHYFERLFNTV